MSPSSRRKAPRGRKLSHVTRGADGAESRMVDVGAKPVSERAAVARAQVRFPSGLAEVVLAGGGPKGPVTEIARAAGLLAAKRTGDLIPMCHPLALDHLEIRYERAGDVLEIRCRAATRGRTGVEMEALVGATIAALTVYDMTKALDPSIAIERVELVEKRGGRSGIWKRAGRGS
jgi:cyclic pyranopterin phosphate synthase